MVAGCGGLLGMLALLVYVIEWPRGQHVQDVPLRVPFGHFVHQASSIRTGPPCTSNIVWSSGRVCENNVLRSVRGYDVLMRVNPCFLQMFL